VRSRVTTTQTAIREGGEKSDGPRFCGDEEQLNGANLCINRGDRG